MTSEILNGIKNFLWLINEYWTTIIVIIGLILTIYKKIKKYQKLNDEQRVELAWKSVSETMLSMVMDVETDYGDWKQAGAIKRSEIINRVFKEFPILEKITNREQVIYMLDNLIDNSLEEMKKVFDKNER